VRVEDIMICMESCGKMERGGTGVRENNGRV
jgi:hypothetical protein